MRLAVCSLLFALCAAQLGPGRGAWRRASPESHGLSTSALDTAEATSNSQVGGRTCYLVIKNGELVYERYRGGRTASTRSAAWSCTKSMCSNLYGIAVEQGWANVNDLVRNRVRNTRQCNNNAQFQHVLTMTGTSTLITSPRFSYDTTGSNCLDTLSDFISENNPQGLLRFNWKARFYQDVLGLEDGFSWGSLLTGFGCGYGVETSCRDMARTALLWANEGQWAGAGQVVNRAYAQRGAQSIFPNSGEDYGYTVWRNGADTVDPNVNSFIGMYTQCATVSRRHNAVIISMGSGGLSGSDCSRVWTASRNAIVSRDLSNSTEVDALWTAMAAEDFSDAEQMFPEPHSHEEIVEIMESALREQPERISETELEIYRKYLAEYAAKNE